VLKIAHGLDPEFKRRVTDEARRLGIDVELLILANVAEFLSSNPTQQMRIMRELQPGWSRMQLTLAIRDLKRSATEEIKLDQMVDRN
jgi:hypothetical protein